jgi:hypothetical protein
VADEVVNPASAGTEESAAPWYNGIEPDLLGTLQTRGWHELTPDKAAAEALKAYRELERFRGVPADQLLRRPKDAGDEENWKAIRALIGAPEKAEDYDLTGLKDEALAGVIRNAAATYHLPKDALASLAADLQKHAEATGAAAQAAAGVKLDGELKTLEAEWGPNMTANLLVARAAAAKYGQADALAALEGKAGYASSVKMFLEIGKGLGEDKFVSAPNIRAE